MVHWPVRTVSPEYPHPTGVGQVSEPRRVDQSRKPPHRPFLESYLQITEDFGTARPVVGNGGEF